MQNKGAIWTFTVLLALASIYQLSFSYFTSSFEEKAENYALAKLDSVKQELPNLKGYQEDSVQQYWEDKYLKNNGNEEIVPVFGYTYQESKSREINLGLDLQGGMSITLEVSIPDIVKAYSGNSNDPDFVAAYTNALDEQKTSNDDFITLFEKNWKQQAKDRNVIDVFHRYETKEKFPAESSNKEVFEILKKEAKAAVDGTEQVISSRINKFGVNQPSIQKQFATGRIQLELPGVKDKEQVRKYLQSTANLEFWPGAEVNLFNNFFALDQQLSEKFYPGYRDSVDKEFEALNDTTASDDFAEDSFDELEDDTANGIEEENPFGTEDVVDEFATEETTSGFDKSKVDGKKYSPLASVFQTFQQAGVVIGVANVADTATVNNLLKDPIAKSLIPREIKLAWAFKQEADPETQLPSGVIYLYALDGSSTKPLLSGNAIDDAAANYSPLDNRPEINLLMNANGAQKWKKITTKYLNKIVAITLDDQVLTAPTINGIIPNGSSVISGNYTFEEATFVSNILKAGALPAPAKIIDEAFVGPSLGEDNIKAGLISFVVALIVVLVYMMFYYNKGGMAADLALVLNLFFLIGILASMGAALTLPGIAGIVLTVGMSVDANVLIFERIREELRLGKSSGIAIVDGYKNSLWSILDANITTFITALILFVFGTGPIKGFGVTLMIGIGTSLFTALLISRAIIEGWVAKKKTVAFSNKLTENLLRNTSYKFINKRKAFYALSAIIIAAGIGSLATRGLDLGVEFSGGTNYRVKFDEPVKMDEIRTALDASFTKANTEIKSVENEYQVAIKTNYLIENTERNADSLKDVALVAGLNTVYPKGNFSIVDSRSVDATISDDFKTRSLVVVAIAMLAIFLYIFARFRSWQFGAGALAAIFHDVLIVLSIFSFLHGVLPFSMSIDQAFIAAVLTVVGYSINDTVVVFDRIREFFRLHPKQDRSQIMNDALNSTISRTINTSLSTFIVLLIIFLFGGESIQGFVFALMIGIVVGTYSSLFIATPIVHDFSYSGESDKEEKKESKKVTAEAKA